MKTDDSIKHVVAIGASAGGLTPLQELVNALPGHIDGLAIVIAQHLSPEYKSMLTEILSRKTSLETLAIHENLELLPNRIYITPPNCDVEVNSGRFACSSGGPSGPRPSIDKLFTSIAKVFKNKTTGIILSGTGQDGSKGIAEIKKAGGVTICQDLESSKYTGMPQAAISTGKVDIILSPEEIGKHLLDIIHDGKFKRADEDDPSAPPGQAYEVNKDIRQILNMLEEKTGTNFNNYKESTIIRRLQKRLHDKGFKSTKSYLQYVKQREDELEEFYKYLLIGVTYFFRDPEAFDALKQELREVIKKKDRSSKIRVWVPGCATGEESVSLAIIISELIEETKRYDLKMQIFATDINKNALSFARAGVYDMEKVKFIPDHILAKYFNKVGSEYEVIKDIKQIILYTQHDLTTNPPFLRLDLISCRNLFIYFKPLLQNHVFPVFQYALYPGGLLFLGNSENIGSYKNAFNTISGKYRIFSRKEKISQNTLKLPATKPLYSDKYNEAGEKEKQDRALPTIQTMVKETLYNSFEDPYVIIDENMDIVEIAGNVTEFIKLKSGQVNLNLLRLIVDELSIETRILISESIKNKKIVRGALRRYKGEKNKHLVRIAVKPLVYSDPKNPHFIVIFESFDIADNFFLTHEEIHSDKESQRNQELEYELIANKQHLNTLVEELETTNEELQALNEELQSSNEELQASNEELETSNEELQATNEELENAYTEIRSTSNNLSRQKELWEQLTIASPDIIIILRGDNYVTDFINPACRELLQENEILGKSIFNISPRLISKSCKENLKKVRETGRAINRAEVPFTHTFHGLRKTSKRYFNVTFAPLHSEQTYKSDIIIYAVDVTDQVNSRRLVENSARFFSTLAESMPQMVWTVNEQLEITYANKTLKRYLGYEKMDIGNLNLVDAIHKTDKQVYLEAWNNAVSRRKPFEIQVRISDHQGNYRWHIAKYFPLIGKNKKDIEWICTATDIHEQKQIEEKKDEFMSIASHELKTPLTTVKAYIELLDEVLKESDIDTASWYVNKAAGGLTKINTLVEDLLDMTRIQTGKLKFDKKTIEFDELVKDAIEYVKPLTTRHKLIVSGQTDAIIFGDSHRLEQVMINLINNAVKYSNGNETILVKTSVEDGNVVFEVTDFGLGVPERYRKKIFERFYRVKTKNNFVAGLGIGLYISKQIIKRHNGKIDVTDHDKEGSTFFFKIPIHRVAHADGRANKMDEVSLASVDGQRNHNK